MSYRKKTGLNTPIIAKAEAIKGKRYSLTFGESMEPRTSPHKTPPSIKVKVDLKDMETGLTVPYDSLAEAAAFLGINPTRLSHRKNNGSVEPIIAKAKGIKGRLYSLIFDGVDETKWMGQHHQQPIKVDLKDQETELIVPYDSLEDAGEALGVDP